VLNVGSASQSDVAVVPHALACNSVSSAICCSAEKTCSNTSTSNSLWGHIDSLHVRRVQTEQLITYISSDGHEVTSSIAQYIDVTFGYQHSFRWWALAISLLYILLLRTVITVATKTLNFVQR
jgi:hypothetical protein